MIYNVTNKLIKLCTMQVCTNVPIIILSYYVNRKKHIFQEPINTYVRKDSVIELWALIKSIKYIGIKE